MSEWNKVGVNLAIPLFNIYQNNTEDLVKKVVLREELSSSLAV